MTKGLQQLNISGVKVYACEFDDGVEVKPVMPEIRNQAINRATDILTRQQRYCVWQLLDYALKDTLGVGVADVQFTLQPSGRWSCDEVHFSLTHSNRVVAVALCDSPVGIDVELIDGQRFNERLANRILTDAEWKQYNAVEQERRSEHLATVWTAKESLFKLDGYGCVTSTQIDTTKHASQSNLLQLSSGQYALSVTTNNLSQQFENHFKFVDNAPFI